MKKLLAMVMCVCLAVMFTACGKSKDQSDSEYVKEKGKLVIGITDYAPMDYEKTKGSGEWIGFDADMAKAFAKELGVEAEFVVIEWDNKIMELKGKSIDCVWNGMTITDEVKNGMEVSNAYCKNTQVVVVKKDAADKYKTVESVKDLKFAAEAGSAGEKAVSYTHLVSSCVSGNLNREVDRHIGGGQIFCSPVYEIEELNLGCAVFGNIELIVESFTGIVKCRIRFTGSILYGRNPKTCGEGKDNMMSTNI